MNIKPDCLSCIYSQVLRVGHTLDLDEKIQQTLMKKSSLFIQDMSFNKTPPENALDVYDMIADELKVEDIYKQIKDEAIKKAKDFIPFANEYISSANDNFFASLKISVAGNVIDLASKEQYDFEKTFKKLLDQEFFIDHSHKLQNALAKSSNVAFFADNAGENIFDEIFLKQLKTLYPKTNFFYFARTKPIINDITYDEVKNTTIQKYASIVDSGVPTPGFLYHLASKEALDILQECEFVISKGMGNYECLSDTNKIDIYHLLKVKCDVVSQSIQAPLGSLICKYQPKDR